MSAEQRSAPRSIPADAVGPTPGADGTFPERIVSLLPSATEILFAIGAGDRVVGVTFECDHPAEARSRRIVSTSEIPEGLTPGEIDALVKERTAAGEDLYRLEQGALRELDPDLVITQDLCAVCAIDVAEVDDALTHLGCRAAVVTLDPMTLDEVLGTVLTVGDAVGASEQAEATVARLRARLDLLAGCLDGVRSVPTLVLEWTDPAFTAGHWVPDLVVAGGGRPVLGAAGERSSGVAWETVRAAGAEVVIVAPCGFGLTGSASLAQHLVSEDRLPPSAAVWAVDADAYVVRPGPRLIDGAELFAAILHPEQLGEPPDDAAVRVR